MSFGKKLKIAFQKMKGRIIVYLSVVLLGLFLIVAPISRAITDASIAAENGTDWWEAFFLNLAYIKDIGDNIIKVFSTKYFGNFWIGTKYFVLFAIFFIFIGLIKALPKHEYDEIENGSSDWATGEQYRILSKKKGIILAEKNYLPVDKRGNVNVLVVRRIWCW